MRLNRIDLIAYGKFHGQSVHFSPAQQDFHLVVGANEAGKSTMRRAIQELLFGMPKQSKMAFRHHISDLKIGGELLSKQGALLDFIRGRSTRSPLTSKDGTALPDTILQSFLGAVTEPLFAKLFCLDLAGLIGGSQNILDASDDVGRLLFQSASGLSSLGTLKASLEKEADELFGPRKSDRVVYAAIQEHEAAKSALKAVLVNTKTWSALDAEVKQLDGQLSTLDEMRRKRVAESRALERVRRLAHLVARLHDLQTQLEGLASAPDFPEGSAQQLASGLETLASQTATCGLSQSRVQEVLQKLSTFQNDEVALARRAEIEQLAGDVQRILGMRDDLAACRRELEVNLAKVAERATELGWPADEAALRAMVPTPLALKTVSTLLTQRGALENQAAMDAGALLRAETDLARLRSRVEQAQSAPVSQAFKAALRNAQAQGKAKERIREIARQVTAAQDELVATLSALGPWRMAAEQLRVLQVPTLERLSRLRAQLTELEMAVRSSRKAAADAEHAHRQSELALKQYQQGHQVVLLDDVRAARVRRDAAWGAIKAREVSLDDGAADVDRHILEADALVDTQRDTAENSARCQSLKEDAERLQSTHMSAQSALGDAEEELAAFHASWMQEMSRAGLQDMMLDDLPAWLGRRERVLVCDDMVRGLRAQLESESVNESEALGVLKRELALVNVPCADDASLEALCLLTEEHQSAAEANVAKHSALLAQCEESQAQHAMFKHQAARSAQAFDDWRSQWQTALSASRLDGVASAYAAAPAAVESAARLLDHLAEVDGMRTSRIHAMEAALSSFETRVADVCRDMGEAAGGEDSVALVEQLHLRLSKALTVQAERKMLTEEATQAQRALENAQAALNQAKASLQTIHDIGGTTDATQLRQLISACDSRRSLAASLHQVREQILASSDGLSLAEVEAEVAAMDVSEAEVRLRELSEADEAERSQRETLTTQRAHAQQKLSAMVGGSDAAIAEAKRLEAVAHMADAAERYIKVATAAKLLDWAIEKYREREQGPMLRSAGAVFSQLTTGRYEGLKADYSDTTPKLMAMRGEERLGVEGLSEGTRDQLFLALRLAALQMHVENEEPMPFIADDLFVNFHDGRAEAGLRVLADLSRKTQVVFLTHHEHLVPIAQRVMGDRLNLVRLD